MTMKKIILEKKISNDVSIKNLSIFNEKFVETTIITKAKKQMKLHA